MKALLLHEVNCQSQGVCICRVVSEDKPLAVSPDVQILVLVFWELLLHTIVNRYGEFGITESEFADKESLTLG